jgi:hypothetical protein
MVEHRPVPAVEHRPVPAVEHRLVPAVEHRPVPAVEHRPVPAVELSSACGGAPSGVCGGAPSGVCGGAPSPDLGLSAFFNSFRKLSLEPFHLAFAASSANTVNILDFKLSPCFEYCICSFGYFPGVRLCFADVSECQVHLQKF